MLKPEEIKCEDVVSEISSARTSSPTLWTSPAPSITHDEEKATSCSKSSPAPTVHLPAVLIYFNNHINKPPSRQEEGTTAVKPEEIKSEDVVSEISSTQPSATLSTNPAPRGTQDEEQMGSSSPAPSVQIPAVLIYFQNHSNKSPSPQEECSTALKPEEIKNEDVVSEISTTQTPPATPTPSPRETAKDKDEGLSHQCSECERSFTTPGKRMAFCSESSSAPTVHFPTVHDHITEPPSHQGDCITMLKPEEIKCEDVVSEISSTRTSSPTLCTSPSPSITHDEERMASCSESSPAPTVHIPAVLIHFHNHIKKPPSHQEDCITMLKPEEIKREDVVSEISCTQSSAPLHTNTSPRHTHDEEKTTSPAPTVHLPAVLIYFNNHVKKPPRHQEECTTLLKTEEIKCLMSVLTVSSCCEHTQWNSSSSALFLNDR
ncbi:hypothetical protein MHYP_G00169730 [Metynnis hypsauchen]